MTRSWRLRAAVSLLVGAAVMALVLPRALANWLFTQDAAEHVLTAHAFAYGAGFVNPVKWFFYVAEPPPTPAFAFRGAGLPLLLALPFALSATLSQVLALHVVLAAVVAAGGVALATRFLRVESALAMGILAFLSPAWLFISLVAWVEVTAVGALLLVLATARGVAKGAWAALPCAAATSVAWIVRPNLGGLLALVPLALAFELGPRRAMRHRGVLTYVAATALALLAIRVGVELATGLAPYCQYNAVFQIMGQTDLWQYQHPFPGVLPFMLSHAGEIAGRVGQRVFDVIRPTILFGVYDYVGVVFLPGVAFALWPRGERPFEVRLAGLAALFFTANLFAAWSIFEPLRYPQLMALPAWLCAIAACEAATSRVCSQRVRRLVRISFPVVALAVFAMVDGRSQLAWTARAIRDYRAVGTSERFGKDDTAIRALCREIEPDWIVAATDPWAVAMICGNPTVWLPRDLQDHAWITRFLTREQPRYVMLDARPDLQALATSPALHELLARSPLRLFEVVDRPPEPRWKAPPPATCAGRGADCLAEVGRLPRLARPHELTR